MGPQGLVRPRRKCSDTYGRVLKGTDTGKGFPSQFQFWGNPGFRVPTVQARPNTDVVEVEASREYSKEAAKVAASTVYLFSGVKRIPNTEAGTFQA